MRALRRPRLDAFEAAVLAALAALSVAVLAGLLVRVWTKGGIVTGSDGFLVVDQLQYLNWLRQAGEHLLVANLYDTVSYPRDYLHPGVVVSGLIHKLGLGLAASYMVWKPVAVVALFAAALLYSRRFLAGRRERRLALVLALFAVSPVAPFVGWVLDSPAHKLDFDFIANEMWPGNYLWGYLFTAIAVAMVPLGLLAYERGRRGGPRAMLAWAAAAGLIASWLQPWQGATFAAVIVVAELLRRRSAILGAARDLAIPLAGAALPLVYYLVLSRADDAWRLADVANDPSRIHRWPWWVTVLALLPIGVPALLAYRDQARDFGEAALRAWPPLAILLFYLPFGTFPFHAFQGLSIPLAVMAAGALRRLSTLATIAFAALLIVPGVLYEADQMRSAVNHGFQPFFLTDGEHDALTYLDRDPRPGAVLAPVYSGLLVPAYTGRQTWVGAGSWTPHFDARRLAAERLFDGRLSPGQARAVVRASGASFLYSDCHGRADIDRTVAAITDPPRRFGCAAVYRIRGGSPAR